MQHYQIYATTGNVNITNNTPSINATTGSITTTGGVGITQDMNVGGDVTVTGDYHFKYHNINCYNWNSSIHSIINYTCSTNLSIGGNAGTATAAQSGSALETYLTDISGNLSTEVSRAQTAEALKQIYRVPHLLEILLIHQQQNQLLILLVQLQLQED